MSLRDDIAREIMLAFAPNAHDEDAPLAHEVALADAVVALVAREIEALPRRVSAGGSTGEGMYNEALDEAAAALVRGGGAA